jgi:hypothetical protein
MVGPSLASLREHRDDLELRAVHADALQAEGDVRGELVALQLALAATETFAEREQADARIAALMDEHPELAPPTPPELVSGPRHAWGCWSGGYLTTLEVLIDRSSPELHPDARSGLAGWVRALRELLSHPACALLERLLLRFDLRGEPIDETEFASSLARQLLADDPSGATPSLDLWTERAPSLGVRMALAKALARHAPMWFASDITLVPPPEDSALLRLEHALAGYRHCRIDLLWFDARGRWHGRLSSVPHGLELLPGRPTSPALRRLAERGAVFHPASLPTRLAHALEGLASMHTYAWAYHDEPVLAPRPTPMPRPLDEEQAARAIRLPRDHADRLAGFADMAFFDARALRQGSATWTGIVGVSPHECLWVTIDRAA